MSEQMLQDRQVFIVKRIEDEALIEVHSTMRDAIEVKEAYESAWNEPCRIGRAFVLGEETLAERIANEKE